MATHSIQSDMGVRGHLQLTGFALRRWFLAQCLDSLSVGLLWLIGLLVLDVPWAPFWAVLAAILHFIPHIGGLLAMLGPMCALVIAGNGWPGVLYLLGVYVLIMVVDGFFLQPRLMRRAAKVPVWASIVVPLVMGYFLSIWGVLLSAPLLAVFFALREHRKEARVYLAPPVEIIPPLMYRPRRRVGQPPVIEG